MNRLLALLVCVSPVFAGPIAVSSYTINSPTEPTYPDDSGTQLTDGSFGSTDLSSSTVSLPWVGWINTNAISMTFNFSSLQSITSVSIDFLNETPDFVFLPDSVNIGGQVFPVAPDALGNPARGTLTFDLATAINTQSLGIEIDRANTGFHILIDEVSFAGSAAASAPEPGSIAIVGAGLLALAAALARRASHLAIKPRPRETPDSRN